MVYKEVAGGVGALVAAGGNADGQGNSPDKNAVWYFNAGFGAQVPDTTIHPHRYKSKAPE